MFEVNDPGKYTYFGVVKLASKPYQETQPDDNGNPRKVWMFPIKRSSEAEATLDKEQVQTATEEEQEAELLRCFDANSVTPQSIIQHNRYGTGIIISITETKIYVEFGGQQRVFKYPEAFEKGWLTL